MLQRMRELAVQASNDTNNSNDRSYLNLEFQALTSQIDNIANYTQWNGANILNRSNGTSVGTSGVYNFQVGANSGQTISITFSNMTTESGKGVLSSVAGNNITGTSSSSAALGVIISALDTVSFARSNMGAVISRLQFTSDNLANVSAKAQESRSRIEDTDYSQATTELAKRNIIQQAGPPDFLLLQVRASPPSYLTWPRPPTPAASAPHRTHTPPKPTQQPAPRSP
jgi:flagellin